MVIIITMVMVPPHPSPLLCSFLCSPPLFRCYRGGCDCAGIPATVRKVFIIGPDRKIKASLAYPTAAGRFFPEILRLVDALQLAAKYPIATPVNWKKGDDVMIQPTVRSGQTRTVRRAAFLPPRLLVARNCSSAVCTQCAALHLALLPPSRPHLTCCRSPMRTPRRASQATVRWRSPVARATCA